MIGSEGIKKALVTMSFLILNVVTGRLLGVR